MPKLVRQTVAVQRERPPTCRLRPAQLLDEQADEVEAVEFVAGADRVKCHDLTTFASREEPQRADDLRLLLSVFILLRDQTKTIFVAKVQDALNQRLIAGASAQQPIEGLCRRSPERVAVDVVDGPQEILRFQEGR